MEFKLPEGFLYVPDFLKEEEEKDLFKDIAKIDLHTFIFQGFEAKRKVASFGFDYNFEKRSLTEGKSIPLQFNSLIEKAASFLSMLSEEFAELLITEYPVGSVINWHRDAPPFNLIVGISLLSD